MASKGAANKKTEKLNPQDDFKNYPATDLNIPLIRRKYWFGLKPDAAQLELMTEPHNKVCFVSSETPECDDTEVCILHVFGVQARNMSFRSWPDIPFNFLIGGDGNIYEGRGWLSKYKLGGKESMRDTLQIAYLGYFKDKDPSQKMVDLGALLIEYGKQRRFIAEDYTYIECPLEEYYQLPNQGFEAYQASPEYKEFLATMPPPPPPRPKKPES